MKNSGRGRCKKIAARRDVQKKPQIVTLSSTLFDFAGYPFSKAEVSVHFCTFLPKQKRESRKVRSQPVFIFAITLTLQM